MTELPAAAGEAALAHLRRLETVAAVSAVHVLGSAVLGDFHPGTSDVDVVVELAGLPADPRDLLPAHTDPGIDAIYLGAGRLNGPLAGAGRAWSVRAGAVSTGGGDVQPVTWLQLARYAATVHGERPRPLPDPAAVRAYCRRNLTGYWAPVLARAASGGPADALLVQWIALGPIRLWETMRTGAIISKSRGAEVAARQWPDLAEPLRDIRAARSGAGNALGAEHHRAALTLGHRILADTADATF